MLLGLYRVVRKISPYVFWLYLSATVRSNVDHPVGLLDLVVHDPLPRECIFPPPLVKGDAEEEYQVSGVEDSQYYRHQLQNLMHWMGYYSLTCESGKSGDGLQAIDEFH